MKRQQGARLVLARVISILTGLLSLVAILKFCLRALTGDLAAYGYSSETFNLHLFFLLAESALLLVGSVFLWRMLRPAILFFFLQLSMAAFTVLYYGVFVPDARIQSFQRSLMFLPTLSLITAFEILRFAAVWWVLRVPSARNA